MKWLEGEEKKLELHVQTKKPIGIIQSELETFYVRKFRSVWSEPLHEILCIV